MTQSVVTKGHAPIQIHGETSTGAAEAIKSTNGSNHVRLTGTGRVSKNRKLDLAVIGSYASATNKAVWTSTDNVTELYLTFLLDDNTAANLIGDKDGVCNVCFDATSDAVAEAWLNQAASGTVDYPNIELVPGQRIGPISFPSYLTRLDAGPVAAGNLIIEAS